MTLIPPELRLYAGGGLIALSFVTPTITAVLSIGGGMTMLAALAAVAPAPAIIPIQGAVQAGSNMARVYLLRRSIAWRISAVFTLGTLAGVAVGGMLVVQLPADFLRIILALFIIYSVWGPTGLQLPRTGNATLLGGGFVTAFLTMFVGATGPFLASVLAPRIADRFTYVATHGLCVLVQHVLKVFIFGALGFAFLPWLPMLALMLVAGFAGTWVGTRILHRLPEAVFRKILRAILTLVAVWLLVSALGGIAL
ncbi:MAG: sulfite exporter TauE/SafE family protein [Alphaproteobacteria bacterium]